MFELSYFQNFIIEFNWSLATSGIISQVRAIKVDLVSDENMLLFWFYFDGEISEREERQMNILAEITMEDKILDFPPYKVTTHILRWDYPKKIPSEGYYIYLRDETIFEKNQAQHSHISPDLYIIRSPILSFAHLYLAGLYALLGRVRPNLRAVRIDLNQLKKIFYFRFYIDGEVSEADKKIAQTVCDAVLAILYFPYTIELNVERVDSPQEIPSVGSSLYKREKDGSCTKTDAEIIEEGKKWRGTKDWHDIDFQKKIIYHNKTYPLLELFSDLRRSLRGEIKPHWRAIKYCFDEFKRRIYLWFYFDKEFTEDDEETVQFVVKLIRKESKYSVKKYVRKLAFPREIPPLGNYFFLRQEYLECLAGDQYLLSPLEGRKRQIYNSAKGINSELYWGRLAVQTTQTATNPSNKRGKFLVYVGPNLRAIKIAANPLKKLLH